MKTVRWRPEKNALTTPWSYSVRYIPRDTVGYEGVADRTERAGKDRGRRKKKENRFRPVFFCSKL